MLYSPQCPTIMHDCAAPLSDTTGRYERDTDKRHTYTHKSQRYVRTRKRGRRPLLIFRIKSAPRPVPPAHVARPRVSKFMRRARSKRQKSCECDDMAHSHASNTKLAHGETVR